MIPNAAKHYATHQNMCLGSNGADWVRSLRKSQRDFVARIFALIAPVDPILQRDSCSYETIPNAAKNMNFWVQWSGLRVFVAKNPDVTSWHKFLH